MIYIYTENLFFLNRAKSLVKSFLGRQNRGPQAVEESLIKGLKELGVQFTVNQLPPGVCEYACVLSGVKTLKWAIKQKQQGKIKKLVAGPNIVVSPNDEKGILKNGLIDIIIVPSFWVKEYYSKITPGISEKIEIWPAGVSLPETGNVEKNIDFLIYDKIGQDPLYEQITEYIQNKEFVCKTINYGQFSQEEYFKIIEQSKFGIYLSKSESQGLAVFQAWARNLPTLVWESGVFEKDGQSIEGKISCPFLSDMSGMGFNDFEDFQKKLSLFRNAPFSPRKYVEENFTNKICAQKYLNICHGKKNY